MILIYLAFVTGDWDPEICARKVKAALHAHFSFFGRD
jgi:hypothetical protein